MSLKSDIFLASLHLPPGVLPDADFRCSGLPSWILLDSLAYMVDVENETAAGITTPDGLHIQVSFFLAEPPRLSLCCIRCTNREENPFACVPRIVSAVEDLVLIEVDFTNGGRQWFVYGARGARGNPSLHLLPDSDLYFQETPMWEAYGLMSLDEGRHFVLAALSFVDGQYDIHIFRSGESNWIHKLLQVDYGLTRKSKLIDPTYVIALGDGLLGWVDLWEGILICDVLALASGTPTGPFIIPMPKPLPSNQELYLQHDFPRLIRDVTFNNGQIKCVELEKLVRLRPKAAPVVYDPSDKVRLYDSESPVVPYQEEVDDDYEVLGWRLVNWHRELTSDHWHRGTMVHSDELGHVILPPLFPDDTYTVNIPFKSLRTCYPTLLGGGVVYLVSILAECNQIAWIVAVDTKIKSLSMPIPYCTERSSLLDPTHIPCALTKYLYTESDGSPVYYNGAINKRQRLL